MPGRSTGGDALSRTLRELRDDAGLRQVDAANRAGVSQALIARFETGRQVPRPDQVEKLCEVYRATSAARDEVVQMAKDARAGTERVVMHRDVAPAQQRINRIAETATLERTFSLSGIPGLLQTRAYAGVVFHAESNLSPEAAERALNERMKGQAILNAPEHEFGFLMTEGMLGGALLEPPGMVEQVERLAGLVDRPNIEIGIIPWGQPIPKLPLNSFTMFDDRLVIVGTTTRVAYLTVRTDLDAYSQLYRYLAGFARHGEAARELLVRAADRYRTLTPE